MKAFLASAGLIVFLAHVVFAGGTMDEFPPQQQSIPQNKIVVVPTAGDNSNTALWVALVGAGATLGAAYIGVRANRRKGR